MGIGEPHAFEAVTIEENGEIVAANAVIFVEATGNQLDAVHVAALADPAVPQPGASFGNVTDVKVIRRTARVVDFDPNSANHLVRVEVEFQLRRTARDIPLRGGATLNNVTTQLDRDGNPLTVTYKGDQQRGELNVPEVRNHFSRTTTIATNDPENEVGKWISHVNSVAWKGGAIRQWLCTNATYQLKNASTTPKEYDFTFEFEKTPLTEGHIYVLSYKDENGNIPVDATIENTTANPGGIRWFEYHPVADFSQLFT